MSTYKTSFFNKEGLIEFLLQYKRCYLHLGMEVPEYILTETKKGTTVEIYEEDEDLLKILSSFEKVIHSGFEA